MSVDYALVLSERYAGKEWATFGEDYNGIQWRDESPKPSQEELDAAWPDVRLEVAMRQVRAERNAQLAACDWTQLPDAPVDPQPWIAYRQELRDFPSVCDPLNPQWPLPPNE